jgi:hypothetical protein
MKVRHIGVGSVHIEGFGVVASGDVLAVSDELAAKLCDGMPTEFERVPGEALVDRVAPRQGRPATRAEKGGGD